MVTIQGSYNTAVCYTPELEEAARKQIQAVCDQAEFAGCKIRIMPDVHAGKGCTIGTTMTIRDKIVPGMVGVDIGCGMETVELREREIDFEKLDALISPTLPCSSGFPRPSCIRPLTSQRHSSRLCCATSHLKAACGTICRWLKETIGSTCEETWLKPRSTSMCCGRSLLAGGSLKKALRPRCSFPNWQRVNFRTIWRRLLQTCLI